MAKRMQRLAVLALVAVALTAAGHGKASDTHGPLKGPNAIINTTTVDGGGRSF